MDILGTNDVSNTWADMSMSKNWSKMSFYTLILKLLKKIDVMLTKNETYGLFADFHNACRVVVISYIFWENAAGLVSSTSANIGIVYQARS